MSALTSLLRLVLAMLVLSSTATLAAPSPKARVTKKAKPMKAPPPPSVGLLSLDGLASVADKAALELELRGLLPATGYVVQDKSELDETLASVKQLGLACDSGDVDCLIRVGALSGTTIVLKGLVSSAEGGDGFALDLVAVDVNVLRERGRVRVTVPAAASARRAALDSALTGVLKPEVWRGELRLGVAQRGASVVVDGVPRGFTPLSAPIELTPGPHALFVVLEGFRTHKETVDVVFQSEVVVDVTLVPGVSEDAPLFSTAPRVLEPPKEPAAPARKHPLRVIVYDVEATGVPPRAATVIGTLLVAELRKREGVSVLDSGELRAVVGGDTTAGDVRGCSEEQCFAEVAEALGADVVVVAQLTQLEGQVLFGLRRIDQQQQEVTGSFLERVPENDTDALLPLVGKSITATFGDVPLRAGQTAGVDERARRIMNPPPLPPVLSGALYVGAGLAAVAAVVGTGVALINYAEYERLYAARADNADLQGSAGWFSLGQTTALIAGGATVVLGVAAVITGFSTDWQGDGDAVAVEPKRTGAAR